MKKLLYIDACVNRGISRTEQLAQALLKEMNQNGEYEIETLNLEDEDLKLFTGKESALRESLTRAGNFEGSLFTTRSSSRLRTGSLLQLRTGIFFPGADEMLSGADLRDGSDVYVLLQGHSGRSVPCGQSPLCDD